MLVLLALTDAHNHFIQGEVDTDGKPHGTGKFQWLVSGTAGDADALYDVYEGQWHSGMMHGAGKKVWAAGISLFNTPTMPKLAIIKSADAARQSDTPSVAMSAPESYRV